LIANAHAIATVIPMITQVRRGMPPAGGAAGASGCAASDAGGSAAGLASFVDTLAPVYTVAAAIHRGAHDIVARLMISKACAGAAGFFAGSARRLACVGHAVHATMIYDRGRAMQLLRAGTSRPDAQFRDDQEAAIEHVVEGRGRLLVVQKTGWGKSFVYFIATALLRASGMGPALLISPLLALMRNQLEAAGRMGVRAETINSENQADWDAVESKLRADDIDLLVISPERLGNEGFRSRVLAAIAGRVGLLVVDEAHCISDWGHDFRPHYRLIERFARGLPPNLRLLATTATANDRVLADLEAVLGPGLSVMRGGLERPSLTLQTIAMPGQAERLAWLSRALATISGSGIVYTLTVRDAVQVATWLNSRGLPVEPYTSQSANRAELEHALLDNRLKALVATTALGMGFDKPDLAFVIHFQSPSSVVAYYQQVGRAGRALESAYGVLLSGAEDDSIAAFFIDSAFPTREEVAEVLEALEAEPSGLSVPDLLTKVNVGRNRIERTVQLLSLESPAAIVKQGAKWQLTAAQLSEDFWSRAERLTELRRAEKAQMQAYARLSSGHMAFLVRALDGDTSAIQPPSLPPLPTAVDPEEARAAIEFLRRTNLPIAPRKQWPPGGLPRYDVRGNIPASQQAQPGRALSVSGDAGWGSLVRSGKHHDGRFDDRLVVASAALVNRWQPVPAPAWVTCVPSLRYPSLVPDFAARLARALGLPFHAVLRRIDDRPAQRTMANSAKQALNLDDSLALDGEVPASPALLVDDLVDSRWTMTVAAWLLLRAGAGAVFPFALAVAGGEE
jgi:ATP-dependent DNA helicase RecQ